MFKISIALVFTLMLAGCPEENVCTPGTTQSCRCSGSASGAQSCLSSGDGWDYCECSTPPTPTYDAGAPSCRPYGNTLRSCGCHGPTNGASFPSGACCSGYAQDFPCDPNLYGYCSGGGLTYSTHCN